MRRCITQPDRTPRRTAGAPIQGIICSLVSTARMFSRCRSTMASASAGSLSPLSCRAVQSVWQRVWMAFTCSICSADRPTALQAFSLVFRMHSADAGMGGCWLRGTCARTPATVVNASTRRMIGCFMAMRVFGDRHRWLARSGAHDERAPVTYDPVPCRYRPSTAKGKYGTAGTATGSAMGRSPFPRPSVEHAQRSPHVLGRSHHDGQAISVGVRGCATIRPLVDRHTT